MELGPRQIRRYPAVVAAGLALVALSGCPGDEESGTQQQTPVMPQFSSDRDRDGAMNIVDPYPDVANPDDWDIDGTPNSSDPLPYSQTKTDSGRKITQSQNPSLPIYGGNTKLKGCPGDKDCDNVPDFDDTYPEIYGPSDSKTDPSRLDSDKDGLKDRDDRAPHTPDRDYDGRLDGSDPDPNHPNDSTSESSDSDKYTDDKDRDRDGEDDVYDKDPNDPAVQ